MTRFCRFKSEDRREIFEEAAGITKFRYRKEEAERRLSATEENLVRIRDLYGELENRLEPLEQQAEQGGKGSCICGMSCACLRSRCGCCRSSSSRMTLPS